MKNTLRLPLRMDLTTDRRDLARVDLELFGVRHVAHLVYPEGFLKVVLVDLSPSGARILLRRGTSAPWLTRGAKMHFNPLLGAEGQLRQDLPCEIRWVAGPKIGLLFTPELTLSVADVFELMSLNWTS